MKRPFGNITDRQYDLGLFVLSLVLLAVVASLVIWHSFGVFVKLWTVVCSILEPLAYGLVLCCMLSPLTGRIQQSLPNIGAMRHPSVRRTVASVMSLGLLATVLVACITVFSWMLATGVSKMTVPDIPSLAQMVEMTGNDIQGFVTKGARWLSEMGVNLGLGEGRVMSLATDAVGIVTKTGFSVMFAAYFLIDGDRIVGYARRVLHAIDGKNHNEGLDRLIDDANRIFTGYFRGQALDALFMGTATSVTLLAMRVPYAPIVGMLTGVGNFVPYVGPIVGYASIAVACMIDGVWEKLLAGVIAMAVIGAVDANVVNPRLLSNNVQIHPAVVMTALIAGGVIGGIAGMIVAVPTATLLKKQVDRWLEANEEAAAEDVAED